MKIQALLKDKKTLNPLIVVIAVVVTLALLTPFTMAQTPTPPTICPPTPVSECPCVVGEVVAWAGDDSGEIPTCYLLADGSPYSSTTYSELYSVIGPTFGTYVPDLRGRLPLGQDDMGGSPANQVTHAAADILGGSAGAEKHTLTIGEMPWHRHSYYTRRGDASATSHQPKAGDDSNTTIYTNYTNYSGGVSGTTQPHNNMPPYLTLNYLICAGK